MAEHNTRKSGMLHITATISRFKSVVVVASKFCQPPRGGTWEFGGFFDFY
jgi:hypothetical protein